MDQTALRSIRAAALGISAASLVATAVVAAPLQTATAKPIGAAQAGHCYYVPFPPYYRCTGGGVPLPT